MEPQSAPPGRFNPAVGFFRVSGAALFWLLRFSACAPSSRVLFLDEPACVPSTSVCGGQSPQATRYGQEEPKIKAVYRFPYLFSAGAVARQGLATRPGGTARTPSSASRWGSPSDGSSRRAAGGCPPRGRGGRRPEEDFTILSHWVHSPFDVVLQRSRALYPVC